MTGAVIHFTAEAICQFNYSDNSSFVIFLKAKNVKFFWLQLLDCEVCYFKTESLQVFDCRSDKIRTLQMTPGIYNWLVGTLINNESESQY